jgi:hypothetical protein
MLNLNLNIIECQRRAIPPVLTTNFEYLLVGAGGGGNAGNGAVGGNGGLGGALSSGSISFIHGTTATISVGTKGVGGGSIGATGTNGTSSSLSYQSSIVDSAIGGLGGAFTGSIPAPNGTTSPYDSLVNGVDEIYWAQAGTKGGDTPLGDNGRSGNIASPNWNFPWGQGSPSDVNAFTNSGGGGAGFRWDSFNPGGTTSGCGADGVGMLRMYDPNDIFDYVGTWSYYVKQNGYKYFYYQTNGTFTLYGKID